MIETAIVEALKAAGGVIDLVAERIYPGLSPRGDVYPYLTYAQVSEDNPQAYAGPAGLVGARFQVDVWSRSHTEAKEVSLAVKVALQSLRETVAGIQVQGVFCRDARNLYRPADDGKEKGVHQVSRDYEIWYRPA